MDWLANNVNWLTVLLVGLTMFMVGGGAQALLEVNRKDTTFLELCLKIAQRLGIVLAFVGACWLAWKAWR
jgi:hypothetical protein